MVMQISRGGVPALAGEQHCGTQLETSVEMATTIYWLPGDRNSFESANPGNPRPFERRQRRRDAARVK